jgi:hypothetical protein
MEFENFAAFLITNVDAIEFVDCAGSHATKGFDGEEDKRYQIRSILRPPYKDERPI